MATSMSEVDHRFTKEIIDSVNSIVTEKCGMLSKWNRILKILLDNKIAYRRLVGIAEVMVHPSNRSGMGVNAYEVHMKLLAILKVGADVDLLQKATAFEMAPTGPARSVQVQFNEGLVKSSLGLLAPLTGDERLLSVACSHTTAGFRAAKANCRTSEEELATDMKLNGQSIAEQDGEMARILDDGFEWCIIPSHAERLWPVLPDIAQGALNADHGAVTQAGELQIMHSMAAKITSDETVQVDWTQVIEHVASSNPPCKDYLDVLATFVRVYAGGDGAPILRYIYI